MMQKKERQKSKQNEMNKSILLVTYIFLGLFLILACYFAYLSAYGSRELINNPYNKLLNLLSNSVTKGSIYSADGELLAATGYDEDNEEYRYYPFGEEFCHVVGSSQRGMTGMESAYNFEMLSSNENILTKVGNDLQGKKDKGNSIVTTLDSKIQHAAFQALENYSGAVIVMDSRTGGVIAMVSNPGYNPNTLEEEWENINDSESSVLLNRATQGLYTPGSVFKLVTLYEYLREGKDEEGYKYDCDGSTTIDGEVIHCNDNRAHGSLDLKDSFAYSCNCSFITIGESLNPASYQKTCRDLLFGQTLPLKIAYNKSSFVLDKSDSDFVKAQTYFGQGETLMTPIHAAMLVQAIANDGMAMKPGLLKCTLDAQNKTIQTFTPENYKQLFEPAMAKKLKEYMRAVVEYGTAQRLNQFENLTVYGKTGSAEIDSSRNINSWFMGFAEKENDNEKKESYTIVVVAENVSADVSTAPAVTIANQVLKVLD